MLVHGRVCPGAGFRPEASYSLEFERGLLADGLQERVDEVGVLRVGQLREAADDKVRRSPFSFGGVSCCEIDDLMLLARSWCRR